MNELCQLVNGVVSLIHFEFSLIEIMAFCYLQINFMLMKFKIKV